MNFGSMNMIFGDKIKGIYSSMKNKFGSSRKQIIQK
jgi:hypothetical protein